MPPNFSMSSLRSSVSELAVVERLRDRLPFDIGVNGKGLSHSTYAAAFAVVGPAFGTENSLRVVSSSAAAPEAGFVLEDKFVLTVDVLLDLVLNFSGIKEMVCRSGLSTMRNGMGLLSGPPGEAELRPSPHPPIPTLIG